MMEAKNCDNCIYTDIAFNDYPCSNCRGSVSFYSKEYNERPLLWEAEMTHGNKEHVDHPEHYNREGAMECIDEMVEVFGVAAVRYFCLLNVWKYRFRAAEKNGAEDLKKSDWYMKKYIELKGNDDDGLHG